MRLNLPINFDFKLLLESPKILSMHSPEDKNRKDGCFPYRLSRDGTTLNQLASKNEFYSPGLLPRATFKAYILRQGKHSMHSLR